MTKEKQIEEMAADLFVCHTEVLDGNDDWRTDYDETARKMTEKGYRKQVEGEWLKQVKVRKNNLPLLYYYKCSLCGVYPLMSNPVLFGRCRRG